MKTMNNLEMAYLEADVSVTAEECWHKSVLKVSKEELKNKPVFQKLLNSLFGYKTKNTKFLEEMIEKSENELEYIEKNKNRIWVSIFFKKLYSLEDKRSVNDCIYNLDDILEKISSNGIDSLTDNEINFLKNYSDTI